MIMGRIATIRLRNEIYDKYVHNWISLSPSWSWPYETA